MGGKSFLVCVLRQAQHDSSPKGLNKQRGRSERLSLAFAFKNLSLLKEVVQRGYNSSLSLKRGNEQMVVQLQTLLCRVYRLKVLPFVSLSLRRGIAVKEFMLLTFTGRGKIKLLLRRLQNPSRNDDLVKFCVFRVSVAKKK